MTQKRKKRWPKVFFIVLLVLFAIGAGIVYYIMPVGSAFAAKTMCSCVFVAKIPADTVRKVELATLSMFDVEVDYENKRTIGSLWGMRPQTVVYRPGVGCTVSAQTDPDELQATTYPEPQTHLGTASQSLTDWITGTPDSSANFEGLDSSRLRNAVHSLFVEDHPEGQKNTRAVVVVNQGKVLAEEYAPGFDRHSLMRGWSMTKSVTNALMGILVRQQRFDIYEPAPIPEWQADEDPRGGITPDMLLRMSSNLDFLEVYAFRTDATEMLFMEPNTGKYASQSPIDGEPGTRWSYSSGTTNILSRIIRDRFSSYEDYLNFPYQELFGPLGMEQVVMEPDVSGTFVGSSYLWATPRDWAKFGQLYLQDGIWQGERILPEGWVAYSSTPTPTAPGGIYGAQFWTPTHAPMDGWYAGWSWPDVPEDAFAAEGYEGQLVCIIPSRQTVIVRLGVTHNRATWNMNDWVAEILASLPES